MPRKRNEESAETPNGKGESQTKKKVVVIAVVTEDYDASKGFASFVKALREKYSEAMGTNQISLVVV